MLPLILCRVKNWLQGATRTVPDKQSTLLHEIKAAFGKKVKKVAI
jgi:hypothetical protein